MHYFIHEDFMENSFHITHQKTQPTNKTPNLKKKQKKKNHKTHPNPLNSPPTFYSRKEPVSFSLSAQSTSWIVVFNLCIKNHNPNNTICSAWGHIRGYWMKQLEDFKTGKQLCNLCFSKTQKDSEPNYRLNLVSSAWKLHYTIRTVKTSGWGQNTRRIPEQTKLQENKYHLKI